MITIETDKSGNVILREGRFVLLDGIDSMKQECWHRAFLFKGDDIFNVDRGIAPVDSLKGSFQTPDILSSQIENQVEDNDEVYEATVNIEKRNDTYDFSMNVNTVYGSFDL